MSPSMSDRLKSAFARPQRLFITPGGDEFESWARAHPGGAVELLVSIRALHELVCEPGLPLKGDEALRGYARQQFAHYFGGAAQKFALAPWRLGEAAGASALHGIDLAALRAHARRAGVRLHAVRPVWTAWLAALPASVRAGTGRLVWVEGDLTLQIRLESGRLVAVEPRRIHALTDLAPGAPLALGRPDSDLRPQPGPAAPSADFLGRVALSPLAWPLAATGLIVLATAFWSATQAHGVARDAQAQLDRVSALRSGRPRATEPVAATNAAVVNRSAVEAQTLLAEPWEATLARVEAAGADAKGVAWLELDVAAGRGELRLEGLTADKLVALQLAEQLGQSPGWGQVVLSRFAVAEPGLAGLRFEINAKLGASR